MVTVALPFGGFVVVIVNAAEFFPAGTSTCAATVARVGLELASATVTPPLGAAALSVTVPVTALPPFAVVGLSVSAARTAAAAGLTVKVVVFVTPPYEAESVVKVWVVTAEVVMANVAEFPPAPTVTLPGTATALLALDRE